METALEHIKHLHAQMNMNSLQLGKGAYWKKKVRKLQDKFVAYIVGDLAISWVLNINFKPHPKGKCLQPNGIKIFVVTKHVNVAKLFQTFLN